MHINTLYDQQCGLGEGIYWYAKQQRLYWLDITLQRIHCYDSVSKEFNRWQLPGIIGCLSPCINGGLIIGFEDKIAHFDTDTSKIKILFDSKSGLRMNDGLTDPAGRFWVGQADDDFKERGKLFRYDPDGQCQVMEEGLNISNGLDWDLARQTFYLVDSPRGIIHAFDYDHESGAISNRRPLVQLPQADGLPDGFILDDQGYLWCCMWDGSKIIRISPDGEVEHTIKMPVQRPTKCAFGGTELQTLYVTSASVDLGDDAPFAPPAGYVFSIDVGFQGREMACFKM